MRYLVVSLLSLVLIGCEPREEQKWERMTCDKRAYLENGDTLRTVDYMKWARKPNPFRVGMIARVLTWHGLFGII